MPTCADECMRAHTPRQASTTILSCAPKHTHPKLLVSVFTHTFPVLNSQLQHPRMSNYGGLISFFLYNNFTIILLIYLFISRIPFLANMIRFSGTTKSAQTSSTGDLSPHDCTLIRTTPTNLPHSLVPTLTVR